MTPNPSELMIDVQKWNENYLAHAFLEKPDFFTRNGTNKPLTRLISEIYPQFESRKTYLKSFIFPQKIDVEYCKKSLEEIAHIIDNINVLSEDEEYFYKDGYLFFVENFGSIYNLSEDVEHEYETLLYSLRLYSFLRGNTFVKDLSVDFEKTQQDLNKNRIFNSPTDLMGIGSTLIAMTSLSMSPYYNHQPGMFIGSSFLIVGSALNAYQFSIFPTEIAYLYLREKCERVDELIEEIIKEN